MKNSAFCPISYKKIDENVARLNGLFTVLLLVVYLLTSNLLPIAFLVVDFFFRAIEKSAYSPLAILSKSLLKLFGAKTAPINAGPKIFAARVGLLFSVLVLLFALIQLPVVAIVVAVIFGACAFLEAAFNYCVACKLYPFFFRIIYQSDYRKLNIKSDFHI